MSTQLDELDDEDREGGDSGASTVSSDQAPSNEPVTAATSAVTTGSTREPTQVEARTMPAVGSQAEFQPSQSTVPEAVTSAPTPTAFNLPPLPPIPAATELEESVPAAASPVAEAPAQEPLPEAPLAVSAPQPVPESPATPLEAAEPTAEAETPARVEARQQPASPEAPAPLPKQGDLLGQATPRPGVVPPAETSREPAPSNDQHPPRDAAQG